MDTSYDRTAEVGALDATLSGVRGLVPSGVRNLPRTVRIPDEPRPPQASQEQPFSSAPNVPVIDLGGADHAPVVSAVCRAATEWGSFQQQGADLLAWAGQGGQVPPQLWPVRVAGGHLARHTLPPHSFQWVLWLYHTVIPS